MDESSLVRFVFLLCLVSSSVFCLAESDQNATVSSAVYIVTLKDRPSVHFSGRESSDSKHSLTATSSQIYRTLNRSASIIRVHDSLLRNVLRKENYLKLYSYHYLINGFSAVLTRKQVLTLSWKQYMNV
jgi:hypothetical protein